MNTRLHGPYGTAEYLRYLSVFHQAQVVQNDHLSLPRFKIIELREQPFDKLSLRGTLVRGNTMCIFWLSNLIEEPCNCALRRHIYSLMPGSLVA